MEALAAKVAAAIDDPCLLVLKGELGAGKTTFVRGFLRQRGYTGAVKSPTYTLVEPYLLDDQRIYHFDLYRLTDPEELEAIGIRDYFADLAICLVEWPERGGLYLPVPDLAVEIGFGEQGRDVMMYASSETGKKILDSIGNTLA